MPRGFWLAEGGAYIEQIMELERKQRQWASQEVSPAFGNTRPKPKENDMRVIFPGEGDAAYYQQELENRKAAEREANVLRSLSRLEEAVRALEQDKPLRARRLIDQALDIMPQK